MSVKTKFFLSFVAVAVGIPTLLLFTTLVNDVFFKDVNFCVSSFGHLSAKSLSIFSAGAVTGFMTSLIVVRNNYWPHVVISLFVLVKIFLTMGCPLSGNPIWYDAIVNGLLISGLWLGLLGALKFPLAPI